MIASLVLVDEGMTAVNIDASKLRFDFREKMKGQHALRLFRRVGTRFAAPETAANGANFAPVYNGVTREGQERSRGAIPNQASAVSRVAAPQVANAREIVSALLGCWPEPLLAVARRVGLTKGELDAWLAGNGALPRNALARLMAIFGLTFLQGEQSEHEADAARPVTTGERYVLLAGNASERVSTVYNFLIGADAAGASVELVPAGRSPAHCWRYLLIMRQPDAPSLICFPRIGRSARMLDNGQLAGFCGQLAVNPDFYGAVQASRTDLEQRPTRALEAMRGLCGQFAEDIVQTGIHMRQIAGRP
jgi:hypothetical protein